MERSRYYIDRYPYISAGLPCCSKQCGLDEAYPAVRQAAAPKVEKDDRPPSLSINDCSMQVGKR